MPLRSIRKVRPSDRKAGSITLSSFVPQAYGELRRIAGHYFRSEEPGRTLQPTGLVHEAFIRLAEHGPATYENRAHFYAVAAKTMRRILIDEARRRRTLKRGGGWERVALDEVRLQVSEIPDYLALDSALTQLSKFDPRLAQIAEQRLFTGLTVKEMASDLHAAESSIREKWHVAEAWLRREMQKHG